MGQCDLSGRIIWALAFAATAAGGCAGSSASRFAGLTPDQACALAAEMSRGREADLREDLRSAFAVRRPACVLVLSGGDADGAFGCGLLAGWRHNTADPRPTFDVVTGVSTGALMATFAFLGDERDDDVLRAVYTRARDADVFDGPFTPRPPDSVFDTGPLRRLIARHVTRDVIERVAAAHRDGRRLYVATVDLDAGATVVWPMSRIAADAAAAWESEDADRLNAPAHPVGAPASDGGRAGAAGLERFRRILLAAAAIPVLFPPVEIDGDLHVDAGLREALFLRRAMLGPPRRRGDPPLGQMPAEPTVYAILNGKLRQPPEAVGDDLLHVGVRSLDLYTDAVQWFNLRDAAHVAAAHDPPWRFRWAAVPDALADGPGPGLFRPMFDPDVTSRLYAAGEALGRSSSAWREGPPELDDDPDAGPADAVD